MEDDRLKKEVLYVAPEERVINYKWEKGSEKLDKNLAVVSVKDIQRMQEEGWKIKTVSPNQSASEGMILVKHPYLSQCYMDINMAEEELFKDKLNCIGRVAKLLGLKEFSAKAVFIEENKREFDASGAVHYKVVDAKAEYKKTKEEKYAKTYCRKETYISPGNYTREDYEKAKNLVKQYKLDDLEYILQQRNPDDKNTLGEQEVKIEL